MTFPASPAAYREATRDSTLEALFNEAVEAAAKAIDWFEKSARRRSKVAKAIRTSALVLFAIGTVAPVTVALFAKFAQSYHTAAGTAAPPFDWLQQLPLAEIGYVLLALAGACVIFDQFFDSSGTWIRARQSQARLKAIVADFKFQWARIMAECGGVLSGDSFANNGVGARLTGLLGDFSKQVEAVNEEDTKEWARRFSANIQRFDQNPNLKVSLEEKSDARAEAAASAEDEAKQQEATKDAQKPASDSPPTTVDVRLAMTSVVGPIDPGSLSLHVDDNDVAVPANGLIELPLEVDVEHTIAGRATSAGKGITGELRTTPTLASHGQSLGLTLQ
ncbi:MAG TPA: SLATT domain-containing protein [Bauldia sp.]|nr:SLATT domain-containing protein [Bauldia sp.]